MTMNLLPITQIIERARGMGVNFGSGDPKIHLAYLTKLGILPQTTKRKIDGEIMGCYPEEVVDKLVEIDRKKKSGWSLATIAREDHQGYLVSQDYRGDQRDVKNLALPFLIIGLVLGYLVAMVNLKSNTPSQNVSNDNNQAVETAYFKKLVSGLNNDEGPIYVISVPKSNFDNLGKEKVKLTY